MGALSCIIVGLVVGALVVIALHVLWEDYAQRDPRRAGPPAPRPAPKPRD